MGNDIEILAKLSLPGLLDCSSLGVFYLVLGMF